MKHHFSIIKRAYTRVSVWLLLLIIAWYCFFSNIKLSEEFTWWVKITVAWNLDENKIKTELWGYLENKWYKINNIWVEQRTNTTKISLITEKTTDEKVNSLSKDIQKFLVEKNHIQSTSSILEQSITWPSVGSYMQKQPEMH